MSLWLKGGDELSCPPGGGGVISGFLRREWFVFGGRGGHVYSKRGEKGPGLVSNTLQLLLCYPKGVLFSEELIGISSPGLGPRSIMAQNTVWRARFRHVARIPR